MVSWRASDGVPISGKSLDSSRNFRTLNEGNTLTIAIETSKKYIILATIENYMIFLQ